MCTALLIKMKQAFFCRNLDLECGFGQRAVITPRNFPLPFREKLTLNNHYAMVGMARVQGGYPLYAEAVNEKGVAMAGLYFPSNAYYAPERDAERDNIASFEIIPWILGQAKNLDEAEQLLERMQITDAAFHPALPPTDLHWILTDGERSLTVESMRDGLHILPNPVGVLTNNPPFSYHLAALEAYEHLTPQPVIGGFSNIAGKMTQGLGKGAKGLPGDYSPTSRFVKAAWLTRYCGGDALQAVGAQVAQAFAALSAVAPPIGSMLDQNGKPHYTVYSCCADLERGDFYYRTAEDPQIYTCSLQEAELESDCLTDAVRLADFSK